MRVHAISDLHIDYDANAQWVAGISRCDYLEDVLVVAGDVTDTLRLLGWGLSTLAARFRQVLFVPGNHDLWTIRDRPGMTSFAKFQEVAAVVEASGASMRPYRAEGVSIVPLFSWYDYSFGEPCEDLRSIWMDFRACRWPDDQPVAAVAAHFAAMNEHAQPSSDDVVITFSHFLPRVDVIPAGMPRFFHPVLGTSRLDLQLRRLNPVIHVFGHSHFNREIRIDGISYVNNAMGYPREQRGDGPVGLVCIYEN